MLKLQPLPKQFVQNKFFAYSKSGDSSSFDDLACSLLSWVHILQQQPNNKCVRFNTYEVNNVVLKYLHEPLKDTSSTLLLFVNSICSCFPQSLLYSAWSHCFNRKGLGISRRQKQDNMSSLFSCSTYPRHDTLTIKIVITVNDPIDAHSQINASCLINAHSVCIRCYPPINAPCLIDALHDSYSKMLEIIKRGQNHSIYQVSCFINKSLRIKSCSTSSSRQGFWHRKLRFKKSRWSKTPPIY